MDQIKKHLFWIILGVVVLGALCCYFFWLAPDVGTAKDNANSKAKELDDLLTANKSPTNPDKLVTPAHNKAIQEYLKTLEAERAANLALWKEKKLDLRFPDVPDAKANPIGFDNWLGKLRDKLKEKLTTAEVKLPENFDKLTFSDSGVEEGSADIRRHSDYRQRYMAVFEEVVDALCSKPGSEEIRIFEPDPAKDEPKQPKPVGPIEFGNFTLHMPDDNAAVHLRDYGHAVALSGRNTSGPGVDKTKMYPGVAMPIRATGIDLEFTTHLSALAGVMRKLESTSRYFATVTKTDFERSAALFPGALNDTKIAGDYAKPKFSPYINSHYGEGPVRVLVSFDIYEYDAAKGKELESSKQVVKPPTTRPTASHR